MKGIDIEKLKIGDEFTLSLYDKFLWWTVLSKPYDKGRSRLIDCKIITCNVKTGTFTDKLKTYSKTALTTGFIGRSSGSRKTEAKFIYATEDMTAKRKIFILIFEGK